MKRELTAELVKELLEVNNRWVNLRDSTPRERIIKINTTRVRSVREERQKSLKMRRYWKDPLWRAACIQAMRKKK